MVNISTICAVTVITWLARVKTKISCFIYIYGMKSDMLINDNMTACTFIGITFTCGRTNQNTICSMALST